jgi:dihydrofolate reductase
VSGREQPSPYDLDQAARTRRCVSRTELVQTLIENDLVDELRLMIDPVVVGGGKRIFRDDGSLRPLRLVDSEVTTTGAILATYAPTA